MISDLVKEWKKRLWGSELRELVRKEFDRQEEEILKRDYAERDGKLHDESIRGSIIGAEILDGLVKERDIPMLSTIDLRFLVKHTPHQTHWNEKARFELSQRTNRSLKLIAFWTLIFAILAVIIGVINYFK